MGVIYFLSPVAVTIVKCKYNVKQPNKSAMQWIIYHRAIHWKYSDTKARDHMVNFFQRYNSRGCSISEDIGLNKLCCCVSLLNGLFVQLVNVLLQIPVCFMLEQVQQLLSVLVTQVQIKELTKEGLFDRQGMATGEGGQLVTFRQ